MVAVVPGGSTTRCRRRSRTWGLTCAALPAADRPCGWPCRPRAARRGRVRPHGERLRPTARGLCRFSPPFGEGGPVSLAVPSGWRNGAAVGQGAKPTAAPDRAHRSCPFMPTFRARVRAPVSCARRWGCAAGPRGRSARRPPFGHTAYQGTGDLHRPVPGRRWEKLTRPSLVGGS
jgi:hypothetical protein